MHDVFQDYYHKDPQSRFTHIPSIPVTIPVAMSTQLNLCYSSRYSQQQLVVTGEDIRATAAALLEAVRQLELDSDAQTIQQTNQESGGKPLRKFFIKRNYSGTVWQAARNCSSTVGKLCKASGMAAALCDSHCVSNSSADWYSQQGHVMQPRNNSQMP